MPDEALPLLQELLTLTQTLLTMQARAAELLAEGEDEGVWLISLVQFDQLLDQRQQLLDQLASLPEASRQLTSSTEPLLADLARLGESLLDGLTHQQNQLISSQDQLNNTQSELRQTYSAMQAYLPSEQTESHYFEQQS